MNYAGKIIGALIGLIVFRNVFGLAIGAFIGHFVDLGLFRGTPKMRGSFIEPLFAFAGALSKSDGRVSEAEIRAAESLMSRLQLDSEQRRLAIDQFNIGKLPDHDAEEAIVRLRTWTSGRRDLAFLLLDMLLDLVYAEGTLAAAKLNLVRRLCAALGVSDAELGAISAMKGYGPRYENTRGPGGGGGAQRPGSSAPVTDPYAVLGIGHDAQPRDIKHAYRKLMSQHHPDKLGNVPEELKRRAESRAREINAAYERIKSERGFS